LTLKITFELEVWQETIELIETTSAQKSLAKIYELGKTSDQLTEIHASV